MRGLQYLYRSYSENWGSGIQIIISSYLHDARKSDHQTLYSELKTSVAAEASTNLALKGILSFLLERYRKRGKNYYVH